MQKLSQPTCCLWVWSKGFPVTQRVNPGVLLSSALNYEQVVCLIRQVLKVSCKIEKRNRIEQNYNNNRFPLCLWCKSLLLFSSFIYSPFIVLDMGKKATFRGVNVTIRTPWLGKQVKLTLFINFKITNLIGKKQELVWLDMRRLCC